MINTVNVEGKKVEARKRDTHLLSLTSDVSSDDGPEEVARRQEELDGVEGDEKTRSGLGSDGDDEDGDRSSEGRN